MAGGLQARYTYRAVRRSRAGKQDLTATSRQSTIKWKHGMNGKQGKIGNQGLCPGAVDLTVIFPPVDVIQVLPGGVHAVLPLMSPLEVFCTISTVFVCMDSARGPHQTLSKNKYILFS